MSSLAPAHVPLQASLSASSDVDNITIDDQTTFEQLRARALKSAPPVSTPDSLVVCVLDRASGVVLDEMKETKRWLTPRQILASVRHLFAVVVESLENSDSLNSLAGAAAASKRGARVAIGRRNVATRQFGVYRAVGATVDAAGAARFVGRRANGGRARGQRRTPHQSIGRCTFKRCCVCFLTRPSVCCCHSRRRAHWRHAGRESTGQRSV